MKVAVSNTEQNAAVQGQTSNYNLEGRRMVILRSEDGPGNAQAVLSPAHATEPEVESVLRDAVVGLGAWDQFQAALEAKGFLFPEVNEGPIWDKDWDLASVEAAYEDLPSLPSNQECDATDARRRSIIFLPSEDGSGYALAVMSPPGAHPVLAARAVAESMAAVDALGVWDWELLEASLISKGFVLPEIYRSKVMWDAQVEGLFERPVGLRGALAKGA